MRRGEKPDAIKISFNNRRAFHKTFQLIAFLINIDRTKHQLALLAQLKLIFFVFVFGRFGENGAAHVPSNKDYLLFNQLMPRNSLLLSCELVRAEREGEANHYTLLAVNRLIV